MYNEVCLHRLLYMDEKSGRLQNTQAVPKSVESRVTAELVGLGKDVDLQAVIFSADYLLQFIICQTEHDWARRYT